MFKINDEVFVIDNEPAVVEQEVDGRWPGKILLLDPQNFRALVGYETDYYYKEKWFSYEDLVYPRCKI